MAQVIEALAEKSIETHGCWFEIYRRSFGEIERFAQFANAVVNDLRDLDLFK